MPNLRRLKSAKIKFLSLCSQGKNQFPVIFKSDDRFEIEPLLKDDDFESKGELTAVVYAPEVVDAEGDVASSEVIKQMAYDFMKETRIGTGIDIRHNEIAVPKEHAYVAESFIIQKDDPRFNPFKNTKGKTVDVTGGWGVVIKIENEELKKKYKSGEWNGISMGGLGEKEIESSEDPVEKVFKLLLSHLNPKGDIEMTTDELKQALKESNESLTKSISEALVKAIETKKSPEKSPESSPPKTPEIPFEGDPTLAEDIKKHLEKIELAKVNWSDPVQVQRYLAKIEKAKQTSMEGTSSNVPFVSNDPEQQTTKVSKGAAGILKFIPSSMESSKKTG